MNWEPGDDGGPVRDAPVGMDLVITVEGTTLLEEPPVAEVAGLPSPPVEVAPAPEPEVPEEPAPEPVPTTRVDEFSRRILALFADVAIVFVTNVIAWAIAGDLASQLIGIVASAAYFTYFEGRPGGRTLGKRWMGLRVVDLGGRGSIGYPRALLRWAGRIVALIPAGLGCIWMLWDPGRQTWQDKMAGTVVARVESSDD